MARYTSPVSTRTGVLCAAVSLLLLLAPALTIAASDRLVLSHSLVSLLSEVPGVWTATVGLPDRGTDSTDSTVDLGELSVERHSSSSVSLTLPSGAAGVGHHLAFNTLSCEEYKHVKGRCYLFHSDTEGGADAMDEVYVDYVVKRAGRPSPAGAEEPQGAEGAEEVDKGPGPRRRQGRRRTATPTPAPAAGSSAPLLRQPPESEESDDGAPGAQAARAIGQVTLDREELRGEAAGVGARDYVLELSFALSEGVELRMSTQGAVFPRTLALYGVTGNVQKRLAAVQRAEKLRAASTLYGRWLSPLVYLAGLYGVLWIGKLAMEQRAKRQEKEKAAKAKEAEAASAVKAGPAAAK